MNIPKWLEDLEKEITPIESPNGEWTLSSKSLMDFGVICDHDEYILCPCRAAEIIKRIKTGFLNMNIPKLVLDSIRMRIANYEYGIELDTHELQRHKNERDQAAQNYDRVFADLKSRNIELDELRVFLKENNYETGEPKVS